MVATILASWTCLRPDLEILQQLDELPGYGGGVVCHLKSIFQISHPLDYHFRRRRPGKGLWPGTGSNELPQYLTADP